MIGRGFAPIVALGDAPLDDLSDVERSLVASFGAARRRAEFVAGRRAARGALEALGVSAVAIARAPDGAPHVVGADVVLSITHGARSAYAAATRRGRLGIDLTDHADAPRIGRIARRAFPRDEERALALADAASACRAWALKEALAKALGIGMLEQGGVERIHLLAIEPPTLVVDGVAPDLDVWCEDVDDGVLALATSLRR